VEVFARYADYYSKPMQALLKETYRFRNPWSSENLTMSMRETISEAVSYFATTTAGVAPQLTTAHRDVTLLTDRTRSFVSN